MEQRNVLGHITHLLSELRRVELAEINAIDQHRAIRRLEQAHGEFLQGGFTRAHPAQNGHLFTLLNFKRDVD